MQDRTLSHLCAFLTVLFWSSAYVFTPVALEHFSVPGLAFLRCATASFCLACMLAAGRKTTSGTTRRTPEAPGANEPENNPDFQTTSAPAVFKKYLPRFVLSGASGFALYVLAFNKGSLSLNPTTSCIIISTTPIISAVMARFCFSEQLRPVQWLAILLAFCGILVLTLWEGSLALSGGIFWMMCAAVLISLYTILQRGLARSFSALQVTTGSFFTGTLLLTPFLPAALAEMYAAPLGHSGLVIFLGLCPSALAYWLWTKALAHTAKTSAVTNYMYLTPFLALLLDFVVSGQAPGSGTFLGGGVILAGLLLFSVTGKNKAE